MFNEQLNVYSILEAYTKEVILGLKVTNTNCITREMWIRIMFTRIYCDWYTRAETWADFQTPTLLVTAY